MSTTHIRDNLGSIIGEVREDGIKLVYTHYRKGVIGFYDTSDRRYTRLCLYAGIGEVNHPNNNIDYGTTDLYYWEDYIKRTGRSW